MTLSILLRCMSPVVARLELVAKRMELVHELVPNGKFIAFLANVRNPSSRFEVDEAAGAARLLGLQIHVERVDGESDFERAFASIEQQRASAVIVATDPFFESVRGKLI